MSLSEIFFSLIALQGNPQAEDTATLRMAAASGRALVRAASPVHLDGRSDEPAWDETQPLPMTMVTPTHRGVPTERTEVLVTYDQHYLYVAGRFYDSDPAGIQVNSLYRDRLSGDDYFGIVIDPFNDNDTGLWFWTNPAGVRGDVQIIGDGRGGENRDWNTHWDVATVHDDRGWFAELRIPFSSLGFQVLDGVVEMGISAHRYIPRKNEEHVFPDIPPEFDRRRPSLAEDVTLHGVSSRRPVYVTPYVLGGMGQVSMLDSPGDRYRLETDGEVQVGGDVRYHPTSNLTLDLSVNTDFAQVEADDQQVNLTRFSLFFPEQRQFFQERSGIFDFLTGGSTRLFYSRRIGIAPDGAAVGVLGGARLVGKVGEWDLGVLDMQTEGSPLLPAENFGVLRVRRRVLNDFSTAGAMLTTRLGGDGSYNVAYGLDGSFRIAGDDYLVIRAAQSADHDVIGKRGFRPLEASAVRVYVNRARARGLYYFVQVRRFGEDYLPASGFVDREDFTDVQYNLSYLRYPAAGPFRRIDPFQVFGAVAFRNGDGSVESAQAEYNLDLDWRSGAGLGADLELYYDDFLEPQGFPEGSVVPPGQYWYPSIAADYDFPPGRALEVSLGAGAQRFHDGWLVSAELEPTWHVSRHLEISPEYELNVVRFPDRDQGFDAHIIRLRILSALDTRLSLNAFAQASSVADLAAINARLRYNFGEGSDLWLVYNEGFNFDREREAPRLPLTESRTVLLKYTHTFIW